MHEESPGDVLEAAFKAIAARDASRLLPLLEPKSLTRWQECQVRIAAFAANGTSEDQLIQILQHFHVPSIRVLSSLDTTEMVRRTLANLPEAAETLRVRVAQVVLEGPTRVHVEFYVAWAGLADETLGIRICALSRGDPLGWTIICSAISPWIVPGFENILFESQQS